MTDPEPRTVVARAPGRVNLIGEHTDYNGGFVLPVAIERTVVVTATVRPDSTVSLRSDAFEGSALVPPGAEPARIDPAWARLPAAVVAELRDAGLSDVGFDAEMASDLPPGGGLSSSAAVASAVALAAVSLAGLPPAFRDRAALAAICRDAEARATGVRCGLMDPYVSLLAEEDAALLIDCAEGSHRVIPIDPDEIAFVIADSGVRHDLAVSAYNRRREECEAAAEGLAGIVSLRELTEEDLAGRVAALPDPLAARVRHVVTENARTLAAVEALERSDGVALGRLLDESHESLTGDYDVSGPEIDALAAAARAIPGVFGARMTGGGFGGFVVAAVSPDALSRVVDELSAEVVNPGRGAWAASARRTGRDRD